MICQLTQSMVNDRIELPVAELSMGIFPYLKKYFVVFSMVDTIA